MEEILAIASNWLFSGKPNWYLIAWYLVVFAGLLYGLGRFYVLDEEFEHFRKNTSYWEHDVKSKPYVPKNAYSSAPAKTPKPATKSNTYSYKPRRPKHPPKPIFFGRIDGKEVNIEGPCEEKYLLQYQIYDWKRWEREHALSKVKDKAEKVRSKTATGDHHEQKPIF